MTADQLVKLLPPEYGLAMALLVGFGLAYLKVTAYVEGRLATQKLEMKADTDKQIGDLTRRIEALEKTHRDALGICLAGLSLDSAKPDYPTQAKELFRQAAAVLG